MKKLILIVLSLTMMYSLHFKIGLQKDLEALRAIRDQQKKESKILNTVKAQLDQNKDLDTVKELTLLSFLEDNLEEVKDYFQLKNALGTKIVDEIKTMEQLSDQILKIRDVVTLKNEEELIDKSQKLSDFTNIIISLKDDRDLFENLLMSYQTDKGKTVQVVNSLETKIKSYLTFLLGDPIN